MPDLGIMIEDLSGGLDPNRAATLARETVVSPNGTVQRYYVNSPTNSFLAITDFANRVSPAKVYPWVNVHQDQNESIRRINELRDWGFRRLLLDIEKESEGEDLNPLMDAARTMSTDIVCSLGAFKKAEVAVLHYEAMEGCELSWQSYVDSGEGDDPAACVKSLFQPDLLVADGLGGRTYRVGFKTLLGGMTYRWCRGVGMNRDRQGYFSLQDGSRRILVKAKFDGVSVWVDPDDFRRIYLPSSLSNSIGTLLGFAPYAKIRDTLDVSSSYATSSGRTPEQWGQLAKTARFPGSAQRGIDLFRENVSDDVIRSIKASIL